MKKFAADESSAGSLHQTFWRWFSFSVLALMIAAAFPARSADVFIDEGDGDFSATPLSSPAAMGKAPASADVPPANPVMEDTTMMELEPSNASTAAGDLGMPSDTPPMDLAPEATTPVEAPKKAAKVAKKKDKKAAVKTAKASKKKEKKSAKKASKKDSKKVAKKSKKKSVAGSAKSAKRKVASFAGGQYSTTSKACAMESAPGAGDSVGTTLSGRKLWVEDSGNTSYWKVFSKNGSAAYVARDCF